MAVRRLAIIGAVLGAAVWAVVYGLGLARTERETGGVRVSGNIELTDAEVAFKILGRVGKRLVDEGQYIEEGQVVAVLDDADIQTLEAELALRRAELEAAKSSLAELEAGSLPEEKRAAEAAMNRSEATLKELEAGSRRQEKDAAQAAVESARVEREQLEREYQRAIGLLKDRVVSEENFERYRAAYQAADWRLREATARQGLVNEGPRVEQIQQARAALAQTTAQYELVRNGPRVEAKDQARARVAQAEAAVRLAVTRREYATVSRSVVGNRAFQESGAG